MSFLVPQVLRKEAPFPVDDAVTQAALRRAGVSSDSRVLAASVTKHLKDIKVDADRKYAGTDGYEHDRHLTADLQQEKDDLVALLYNPHATKKEKKIAILKLEHLHNTGKIVYKDTRLGKLPPPPTTATELASLLHTIGFGEELKKITVKIDVEKVFTTEIKVEKEVQPVLAVVCSSLPSARQIQQDPDTRHNWLVGPSSPDRLVLFFQVKEKLEVKYSVQVHIHLSIEVQQ
ncbi:hypothetical protein JCM8547_009367 [Rhodosporidiobolus lusitaniae]